MAIVIDFRAAALHARAARMKSGVHSFAAAVKAAAPITPDNLDSAAENHFWNLYTAEVRAWQANPSPLALGRMLCALTDFYDVFLHDGDARARAMIDTIARILPEAAAVGVEFKKMGSAHESA